jgi:hypothetical protein
MDPVAADLCSKSLVIVTGPTYLKESAHKVLLAMATASVVTAATIVTNHL